MNLCASEELTSSPSCAHQAAGSDEPDPAEAKQTVSAEKPNQPAFLLHTNRLVRGRAASVHKEGEDACEGHAGGQ